MGRQPLAASPAVHVDDVAAERRRAAMRRIGTAAGQIGSFSASSSSEIHLKASLAAARSRRLPDEASMTAMVPG
jgi:hypothetical protein